MRRLTAALAAILMAASVVAVGEDVDAALLKPTAKQAARFAQKPRDGQSQKIKALITACEQIFAGLDRSDPTVQRKLPRMREKLSWLYDEYNSVNPRDYRRPNHPFEKALNWIGDYDLKRSLESLARMKDPEQTRRGKQPTGALLRVSRKEQFLASWDLFIPRGYDPAKKHPLIICFHTSMSTEKVGEAGYFLCQSFQRGPPASDIHLGHMMVSMIRETAADFSIDLDRIYLTGFSTGGATAFVFAYRFTDLIAAVAPVCPAAEWRDGGTRHAHNVPTYVMYGKGDGWNKKGANPIMERLKASGHPTWEAYPYDAGHAEKPVLVDDTSQILGFFGKHKRDPYPKTVWKWVEHKRWALAYWLMIKLKQDGKSQGGLKAEIKEGNVIEMAATEGVAAVVLYLNKNLVDMGRPVKVVVNDKTLYEGPIKPELYVEVLKDHKPYWQDRMIGDRNPYWVRGRSWPEPGKPFSPPAWLKK